MSRFFGLGKVVIKILKYGQHFPLKMERANKEGTIDDYFDRFFSEEMIVSGTVMLLFKKKKVYGSKLGATRCAVLRRRGASRCRYGQRSPTSTCASGVTGVTELNILFSVNGGLHSSARGGGASRRRHLHAFVSCFVYFYFSLSESIRDSMVSH